MKKKFVFRKGSRISGDPQGVGEELEKVRKAHGALTPEVTVEEAKDREKFPNLHKQFEWDDSAAGLLYRMDQARTVIKCVMVVPVNCEPQQQYYHVAVPSEDKPTRRYEPVECVVEEIDWYQSALGALMVELRSAGEAVRNLQEAAGQSKHKGKLAIINIVVKALDTAQSAVKQLSEAA